MQLNFNTAQREDAIKSVIALFQEYAGAPEEAEVTRALMFIASDLMELRRLSLESEPTKNFPKFIIKNNPAQFRYTVVMSPIVPPVETDEPLGFIHSDNVTDATTRFQQAVSQGNSAWVSLWDNTRRKKIGELHIGGEK